MDHEIQPQVSQTSKLPKFLTTITPFSKAVALSMYIIFPLLGFYFGFWYQKQTVPSTKTYINNFTIKPSSIPTPTPDEMDCDPSLICKNNSVYYIDKDGKQITVAQAIEDSNNHVNDEGYEFASISPNKKFISVGGVRWESVIFNIYEISSGKTHTATAKGYNFGNWLPDNRILVIGECGMGIDCGIFVSNNSQEPWKMSQVFDAPVSWTK